MRIFAAGRRALLVAGAIVAVGCAPKPSLVPEQHVEIDRKALEKFYGEIQEYVELRKEALKSVPPVAPGATAQEIAANQQGMTVAIRAYRRHARQGEIFKPPVEAAIRRIFAKEFAGPDGPAILRELRSGNPKVEGNPKSSDPTQEVKKPMRVYVNALYPEDAPFSSVPPSLLLKLPQLPDAVRYRFVGRDLILRDTEANVILDVVKDIVPDRSIPR